MKYYERSIAVPMRFYKVIKVLLGIQLTLGTISTILFIPGYFADGFNLTMAFLALLPIATLVLAAIALNGLLTMNWFGVKALIAAQIILWFNIIFTRMLSVNFDPYWSFIYCLIGAIYCAIEFPILYIYFKKRRLCFNPVPTNNSIGNVTSSNVVKASQKTNIDPSQDISTVQDNSVAEIAEDIEIHSEQPHDTKALLETPVEKNHEVETLDPQALSKKNSSPQKHPRILLVVLAVVLMLSLAGNIYGAIQMSDLEEKKDTMSKQCESYRKIISQKDKQITEYRNKADFLDFYVAIISSDGSNLYHTYDCKYLNMTEGFYAYNITAAEAHGYRPCQHCHPKI